MTWEGHLECLFQQVNFRSPCFSSSSWEPSPRPLWVTQSDCITEQIVFHSCENNSVLLLPGFTLYFPPVHVTSQFICSPVSSVFISLLHHQPPPTLYHLFPSVIPPPPPPACQLLRLALIVSQFQCQEGRIYRNQRWQDIAAPSSGPIHRGPSVAMPESIRLPFITEHCLCRDLETSFLSVSSVLSPVFSEPLTKYHWV